MDFGKNVAYLVVGEGKDMAYKPEASRVLKTSLSIMILLTLFSGFGVATNADYWSYIYGAPYYFDAISMDLTHEGYIVLASDYNYRLRIVKLDAEGYIQWVKQFSTYFDPQHSNLFVAHDGDFVFAGNSAEGFGILKISSEGKIKWQKEFSTPGYDSLSSIIQTSDEGYALTGYTVFSGRVHIFVMKFNPEGDIEWQKIYAGTAEEYSSSIIESADNGYIVAGYTYSFGSNDFWILWLDGSGEIRQQKTYGDSEGSEQANSILLTTDNALIVAGMQTAPGIKSNLWVLKIDSAGDVIWQKTYKTNNGESVQNLLSDGIDSSLLLLSSGTSENYTSWLMKLNSAGDVEWQKSYGGTVNNRLTSIRLQKDGYILAGQKDGNFWLFNTDQEGTPGQSCEQPGQLEYQIADTNVVPADSQATTMDAIFTETSTSVTTIPSVITRVTECYNPSQYKLFDQFDDGILSPYWTYDGNWLENNDNLSVDAWFTTAKAMFTSELQCSVNCTIETNLKTPGEYWLGFPDKNSLFAWYRNKSEYVVLAISPGRCGWTLIQKVLQQPRL
jgi:hypothetical protein